MDYLNFVRRHFRMDKEINDLEQDSDSRLSLMERELGMALLFKRLDMKLI